MFRPRTRSSSSNVGPTKIALSMSANTATTATTATTTTTEATMSSSSKGKFGFSEIARLFIRLRRHQSRSSLATQARKEELAKELPSPEEIAPLAFPSPASFPAVAHTSTIGSEPQISRMVLTPPASPSRNRVRRLTGGIPYSRTRATSVSLKPKPHHLVSSSGEVPITQPGIRDSQVDGAHALPVEYTDRFECAGGVNTSILLRATRKAILEAVGNLGANALIEERWNCTICGPKHGTYRVEITYSASATRCTRLDGFRPVALDQAQGIPGLMTITKRNEE